MGRHKKGKLRYRKHIEILSILTSEHYYWDAKEFIQAYDSEKWHYHTNFSDYVYFIYDKSAKYVKIGRSSSPLSRLACTTESVLGFVKCVGGNSNNTEAVLHALFSDKQVADDGLCGTEFFKADKELLNFIKKNSTPLIGFLKDRKKVKRIYLRDILSV